MPPFPGLTRVNDQPRVPLDLADLPGC
jgi:hypothetical protein